MSILSKREDGGRSHRRTIRSGEVEDESNFGHTEFEVALNSLFKLTFLLTKQPRCVDQN